MPEPTDILSRQPAPAPPAAPPPAEPAPPPAVPDELRFYSDDVVLDVVQELISRKMLTDNQLGELQNRATLTGQTIDRLLLDESIVDEPTLLQAFSKISGVPFRKIADLRIDREVVERVGPRPALRHRIMPIAMHDGVMTLATARLPNLTMVDGLRMLLDCALDWVLCTEEEVDRTLTHFYGLGADTIDQLIAEAAEDPDEGKTQDIAAASAETGMVRFINMIIAEAIRMDATDIHIEPFEDQLRLRCRVDGLLQEVALPKGVEKLKRAIASAVKIMANLDIAERRKAHDGRIRVRYNNNDFDLRVSILPTGWGETCCLRILNRSSTKADLDSLGLSPNQLPKIAHLCDLPHGVILLTGPTGSGKTTTLYAILARLNVIGTKIITVEDPIEYQMKGINQVQVNTKIGLTFATVLRSILRHDPDVILIGEIRDNETADIAVRSALTGHLVLSTLHTNDAPSSVARLIDMGVEPYLIASCVEGIVAQRLVRRVCLHCKRPVEPDPSIRAEIAATYPDLMDSAVFLEGNGCPNCSFMGYRGRSAINEVMLMSDPIRAMVTRHEPSNVIKAQALSEGMVTLRKDGWLRVIEGRTSIDEVLRVAGKME
ncbi:MAG: GspE/PulE family protein [Kiritimatiellia bacterium]|jgi:type IV pilus assembly protein PilB